MKVEIGRKRKKRGENNIHEYEDNAVERVDSMIMETLYVLLKKMRNKKGREEEICKGITSVVCGEQEK